MESFGIVAECKWFILNTSDVQALLCKLGRNILRHFGADQHVWQRGQLVQPQRRSNDR